MINVMFPIAVTLFRWHRRNFRSDRRSSPPTPPPGSTQAAVNDALRRHVSGDWGELCPEDANQNEFGLKDGGRLYSVYGKGENRFWIITEWDRSVTTVLLPEDYYQPGRVAAPPRLFHST